MRVMLEQLVRASFGYMRRFYPFVILNVGFSTHAVQERAAALPGTKSYRSSRPTHSHRKKIRSKLLK
jgi:hypothetical protein